MALWEKLKKIQKFKIQRDGMWLSGLLTRFFIAEKYEAIQLFFEKLIQVPFLENLPAWANTEEMLCLCYEIPNASAAQKQAIEKRFLEIANFKTSVKEAQEIYQNYLPNILSLKDLNVRKEQIKKAITGNDKNYEKIMRLGVFVQAIRVKIANSVTDKNADLERDMNKIITEQVTELRSDKFQK